MLHDKLHDKWKRQQYIWSRNPASPNWSKPPTALSELSSRCIRTLITRRGPQRKPNAVFAMGRAGTSEYFLPKYFFGTCIEDSSREETPIGNVIVECKALSALTEREHYQVFGYMRGTGWPVAILVNFGASPRAQIERFYNDNNTIAVF